MASRLILACRSVNKLASRHVFESIKRKIPNVGDRNKICQQYECYFLFGRTLSSSSGSASDDELPKRPKNSFSRFYLEKLDEIKEMNPAVKRAPGLAKIAGEMWKALSDDEKKTYKEAYVLEKKEYDNALTNGLKEKIKAASALKRAEKKKKIMKKERVNLGRPKAPATAFAMFVKEKASDQTHELAKQQELIKDIALLWKAMIDAEKKPYKERAAIERSQYQEDLKVWEEKMAAEGKVDLLRKSTQKQVSKAKGKKKARSKKAKSGSKGKSKSRSKGKKSEGKVRSKSKSKKGQDDGA